MTYILKMIFGAMCDIVSWIYREKSVGFFFFFFSILAKIQRIKSNHLLVH